MNNKVFKSFETESVIRLNWKLSIIIATNADRNGTYVFSVAHNHLNNNNQPKLHNKNLTMNQNWWIFYRKQYFGPNNSILNVFLDSFLNDSQIIISPQYIIIIQREKKNENIHSVSNGCIIGLMWFYSMQNSNLILFPIQIRNFV